MAELILPFKPFTIDEVRAITKAPSILIDAWVPKLLPWKHGCGVSGLDYMGTFAVYVGSRWIDEGSGSDRANKEVSALGSLTQDHMLKEFEAGRTFPAFPKRSTCIMVEAPDNRIGNTLRFDKLYVEFKVMMLKVFPRG